MRRRQALLRVLALRRQRLLAAVLLRNNAHKEAQPHQVPLLRLGLRLGLRLPPRRVRMRLFGPG